MKKAAEPVQHTVTVEATYDSGTGTYTLQVEADGQTATIRDVDQADLETEIGRVIRATSKAQRNGTLTKRQDFSLGMNTPRGGRAALRFG